MTSMNNLVQKIYKSDHVQGFLPTLTTQHFPLWIGNHPKIRNYSGIGNYSGIRLDTLVLNGCGHFQSVVIFDDRLLLCAQNFNFRLCAAQSKGGEDLSSYITGHATNFQKITHGTKNQGLLLTFFTFVIVLQRFFSEIPRKHIIICCLQIYLVNCRTVISNTDRL